MTGERGTNDNWDEPELRADGSDGATRGPLIDVEGYEGPIDVLLQLARDQKVDLVHISILQLADQFLEWVAAVRRSNLELAADYLVMAAWIAYLKSRLLLPKTNDEDEPSGEEMAAALAFQLLRLEAMQGAGAKLMEQPRLGREVFARGQPESFSYVAKTIFDVTLYDLLRSYADQVRRADSRTLEIEPSRLYSVEKALARFRELLGRMPDWNVLQRYLPTDLQEGLVTRSAIAATFSAALEMAKEGRLHIRQSGTFGDIYVKPSIETEDVLQNSTRISGDDDNGAST